MVQKSGLRKVETAVVVVGNTGAGKSTTISSLQGARLIKTRRGKVELDSSENTTTYPKIGMGINSQTAYPEFFESKKTQLIFIDCPGLNDSRGNLYNMVRDATLECTIKSIVHPKIMVIVAHDEITSMRGSGFKDLISHFSPLFQPSVLDSVLCSSVG